MLTLAAVKNARPRISRYKLWDTEGLALSVAPTSTKSWLMRIRHGGRETTVSLGHWPEVSLAEARERGAEARDRVRRGEEARAPAPAAPITFGELAAAWLAHKQDGWAPVHYDDVVASLDRDVLPAIGGTAAAAIGAPAVLELLQDVEARGSIETARRVRQRISRIYRLAIARGLVPDYDPAGKVVEALRRPAKPVHHPAALTIADARAALAAIAGAGGGTSLQLAARFLALTAVRWAAVRGARWREIEQLDGPEPLWRIPAARMKGTVDRKADPSADHLVPLSPAAVELLRLAGGSRVNSNALSVHEETLCVNRNDLIFPGAGTGGMMGEGAMDELHHRAGLKGQHTPHGWRASFSTILVERRPADRTAIDLALGHAPKSEDGEQLGKVELAYMRAQFLGARRVLFDLWAEWLVGSETVPVPQPPVHA